MKKEVKKIKRELSRREFIHKITKVSMISGIYGINENFSLIPKNKKEINKKNRMLKTIRIKSVNSDFEREPLVKPMGFKGGYITEKWQVAALLESESGYREIGLCSPSVLWSDKDVALSHTESAGYAIIFLMLEHALSEIKGSAFNNPIELFDSLLPITYEYGKKITQNKNLRETFALNSLVALDNAAWLLYARENGIGSFDEMVTDSYKNDLSYRSKKIASTTLISYGITIDEIKKIVEEGYFILKIKIGQPGIQEEMLNKDKNRIWEIHKAVGDKETPYTEDGKVKYYLDANGRYENKEIFKKFLNHVEKIGALEQIIIMEEPFPEEYEVDVSDLGVCIAADESAHTDKDVEKRVQMGYCAICLKAIAKTLSMTLKIIKAANKRGVPCFCADTTANPILVDWNKNIAARLAPLPGLGLNLLETNGSINYFNWDKMVSYHPCGGASWTITKNGVINLNDDFYQKSGGIFLKSKHYLDMFRRNKS